jgi:predicted NBD/HSP70 family sugar kinase
LEQYANSAALRRYTFDLGPREAIRKVAAYLARGCTAAIELLDPELIVLAGGLAQENPQIVDDLSEALDRRVEVRLSSLGYYGGVAGAAAVALERLA